MAYRCPTAQAKGKGTMTYARLLGLFVGWLVMLAPWNVQAGLITDMRISTTSCSSALAGIGVLVSGPGVSEDAFDNGNCSHASSLLQPGDTATVSLSTSYYGAGEVDGQATYGLSSVFSPPWAHLRGSGGVFVEIPLDSTDKVLTLHGPATGTADLQFFSATGTETDYFFQGTGIGTVTARQFPCAGEGEQACGYSIGSVSAELTAVPEPSAWLLFASGLGMVITRRRSKAQLK